MRRKTLDDRSYRNRHRPISDRLPPWETFVMLAVLFSTWWLVDTFLPSWKIGKEIGVFASLAAFAAIVWISVILQKKKKKRKIDNCYQRRVDALKADGIPITHENIYNKSIRPDMPIEE